MKNRHLMDHCRSCSQWRKIAENKICERCIAKKGVHKRVVKQIVTKDVKVKRSRKGNGETLKSRIIKFMGGKQKIELKDLYAELNETRPEVIRALINLSIRNNDTFERLGGGSYKLK